MLSEGVRRRDLMKSMFFITLAASAFTSSACSRSQGGATMTTTQNNEKLPAPVEQYVTSVNSQDLEGIVNSFLPDGLIIDVGRHIKGSDAIRKWADDEVVGGKLDVLERHPTDAGIDLLVRFTPPGSNGGFRAWYRYTVKNDKIEKVDLTYA